MMRPPLRLRVLLIVALVAGIGDRGAAQGETEIVEALAVGTTQDKVRALQVLAKLDSMPDEYLLPLVRSLLTSDEEVVRVHAARVLVAHRPQTHENAILVLRAALSSEQEESRYTAALGLVMAERSSLVFETLEGCPPQHRSSLWEAITASDASLPGSEHTLAVALRDIEVPSLQWHVIGLLPRLRVPWTRLTRFVPALGRALADPGSAIEAASAIERLRWRDDGLRARLRTLFRDASRMFTRPELAESARRHAARALAASGESGVRILAGLMEQYLEQEDILEAVVDGFRAADAADAMRVIGSLLVAHDPKLRAWSLRCVPTDDVDVAETVFDAVCPRLRDGDDETRRAAAASISDLSDSGVPPPLALTMARRLVPYLEDEDTVVQRLVVNALAHLNTPLPNEAGIVIVELLRRSDDATIRRDLAILLVRLHDSVPGRNAALLDLLRRRESVSLVAAALARAAPDEPSTATALRELLGSDNALWQIAGAKALGRLGQRANAAVTELQGILERPSRDIVVRIETARAIWRINGSAERLLAVLREVLERSEGIDPATVVLSLQVARELQGEAHPLLPLIRRLNPDQCRMSPDAVRETVHAIASGG